VYEGGSGFVTQTVRVEAAGGSPSQSGAIFRVVVNNNTVGTGYVIP